MLEKSIRFCFCLIALLCTKSVISQTPEPFNGVENKFEPTYLFKNATIYVSSNQILENASLLVKGDEILEVGKAIIPKKGVVEIDCEGKYIFPSFIDIYASYGIKNPKRTPYSPFPQINSKKQGAYYWNEAVKPEVNADELVAFDAAKQKSFLNAGFGLINSHAQDGIARGTGVLMNLNTDDNIVKSKSFQYYSFQKGVSKQDYPSSQMGSIALLKQFFADATWYEKNKEETNLSLEAQIENANLPSVIGVKDKLEIFRADKLGDAFDLQFIIKSNGNEYQRLDEVKATNAPLIVPLNFPKGIATNSPYDIAHIPLSQLKHWELAPSNPYFLASKEIPFVLSMADLKDSKEFLPNLRKAIARGLSVEDALYALTEYPAQLLHVDADYGTLSKGKKANFIICSGNIFQDKSKVLENWVAGEKHQIQKEDVVDLTGKYNLNLNGETFLTEIKKSGSKHQGKLTYIVSRFDSLTQQKRQDTIKAPLKIKIDRHQIAISFEMNNTLDSGTYFLGGTYETKFGIMDGDGFKPNGEKINWSAIKLKSKKKKSADENKFQIDSLSISNLWFPNMAYGYDTLPSQEVFLIRNATIWTNESQGILQNADILIRNGKIERVGKVSGSIPKEAVIINAKGKHVTCGIIDEHSHIAISKGVNESGQAISAEVSIGDVVDSYDIDIYRQLAGGVTTSQLLHGSANPIGGQSAIIKLKWGSTPEQMLFKDAPKFIKFALGENVKQTNWGDFQTVRFPQTRMGVEQVFYDAFKRAKAYKAAHEAYNQLSDKKKSKAKAPAVDYELEVLNEILESERFITCHSYIQSEINMLMKVADSMGFTLNTFTHILEGYKVADKMKEHGAGGSTFADWWAYKYEVNDAIPYNASMLNDMGIVTAINSDDAEMGRRLNQEAGKAVKYGKTSQEDAWKMVTLNPAKLLHIDDKVGSLKVGKDADVVIWSDNPLSVNAKVEKTFVDGILLFDASKQDALNSRNLKEKMRILSKMNKSSGAKKPFSKKKKTHYHCDTIGH